MTQVFISYSRKDIAFAHILVEALKFSDLETWIDWEDIPPSADWLDEIFRAIEAADTFVYIVSHHSKNSEVCSKEVQHAIANQKRLIPIVIAPEINPAELPSRLAALNWIIFPNEEELTPQAAGFQEAFDKLLSAIQTDLDWVKVHTRLQMRALEWQKNQRESSFCLRGRELGEAESWLAQSSDRKEPQPTDLQRQFVFASRKAADRRQRITLAAVVSGLVVALVLAIVALQQRNLAQENAALAQDRALAESYARSTAVAESSNRATAEANALDQRATAEAASTQAVVQRDEALRQAELALAGKLAAQSQLLLEDQLDLALLLSVEAGRTAETTEAQLASRLALEYSPRLLRILKASSAAARPFAISPDGQTLAVSECVETIATEFLPKCSHGMLVFYDISTGETTGQALDLGPHSASHLAFNQLDGGKTLILLGYESVSLWDTASGGLLGEYPTGQIETRMYPTAAAFSPDGRLLAIGSCADRSQGGDSNGYCNLGEVRLWDIQNQRLLGQPIAAHSSNVDALAFRPDSRVLASAGDQTIKLWALPEPDGTTEAILQEEPLPAADTVTSALAFSPDGALLAAGGSGNAISLWDLATRSLSGSPMMVHTYWVSTLQFSPDGKILASGSWDDSLILWDVASRQPLGKSLTGHASDVLQVGFSPDGQRLASTDLNGTLITWDTSSLFTGSPLGKKLPPVKGIFVWTHAFSPDGKILAYSAGRDIYLWDIEHNQPLTGPLQGHPDDVRSLVFPIQDAGNILVSADRAHVAITWDVASGKSIRKTGQDLPEQPEYLASYARVDLSPDGRWLAVAGCSQKQVNECIRSEFWLQDTITGEMTRQPLEIEAGVSLIRFSHDGRLLALASGNQAILWNMAAQKVLYQFQPGEGDLDALAFNQDDALLATKGDAILLWDLAAGQPVGAPILDKTLSSEGESLAGTEDWGIAFSPDGRWLATVGSASGSLLLVEAATGLPYGGLLHDTRNQLMKGMLISAAFSPDGKILVSGNNSGEAVLWNVDPAAWQEMACATVGRSLTPAEWAIYLPASDPYQPACP